jgi:hypothetical protein
LTTEFEDFGGEPLRHLATSRPIREDPLGFKLENGAEAL